MSYDYDWRKDVWLLTQVRVEYDYDSVAEAIGKSANVALEKDEGELLND